MFLVEPPSSQYDLRFQIAGIPVRIHPFFWLAAMILGASGVQSGFELLLWVGIVFVSILVHEFGHALAHRFYGQSARVVLYMLGGMAISGESVWSGFETPRARKENHIVVSAAGPGAGFLLAAAVVAVIFAMGGSVTLRNQFPFFWQIQFDEEFLANNVQLYYLFNDLLWVNIFWGLINLLPVYPLDGGQIARELFTMNNPGGGVLQSLWLSVFAGGGMAFVGLMMGSILIALFFGMLAYSSYQTIQQFTGGGGFGGRFGGGRGW